MTMIRRAGLAILLALLVPVMANACPVCYGNSSSPMAQGTNNAVWFLLGIVAFIQSGFIALFLTFRKRARELRRHRESFKLIEGGAH